MTTYVLEYNDDEDARFVAELMELMLESSLSLSSHSRELLENLRDSILVQIPVPVPTKIGAIVRTDAGFYLRWAWSPHTTQPWIETNNVDSTVRTEDIGRVLEVLAPGVDL